MSRRKKGGRKSEVNHLVNESGSAKQRKTRKNGPGDAGKGYLTGRQEILKRLESDSRDTGIFDGKNRRIGDSRRKKHNLRSTRLCWGCVGRRRKKGPAGTFWGELEDIVPKIRKTKKNHPRESWGKVVKVFSPTTASNSTNLDRRERAITKGDQKKISQKPKEGKRFTKEEKEAEKKRMGLVLNLLKP